MASKIILASLLLVVAAFVLEASADPSKMYVQNCSRCDAESVAQRDHPKYTCSGCCKHRGYDKGKNSFNYCTCTKRTTSKVHPSDELREKNFWGSDTVWESSDY